MKHILPIIVFLILAVHCNCQTFSIKGYTRNVQGAPIPYASIGIENNNVGCISDKEGYFQLHIPDSLKNTQLTFTHLSYKKCLKEIHELITGKDNLIILEDSIIDIPEIQIIPQKGKWLKNKGIRIPKGSIQIDSLGEEVGILFNMKEALLEEIQIPILKCTHDSVKIRINMYQIDDKLNATPIFILPIHKTITKNTNKAITTIYPENITYIPTGKIGITIEMIEIYGTGELLFPLYSAHSLYKKIVLNRFEKIPFCMGLKIYSRNIE